MSLRKPCSIAVLVCLMSVSLEAKEDYSQPGPYSWKDIKFDKVRVENKRTVPVTVTLPSHANHSNETSPPRAPYPVIIFLSGFQCTPCLYTPYAERFASWGFAFVQYKGPVGKWSFYPFVKDAEEVLWIPPLLDFLANKTNDPKSPLHGALDLEAVGMAGHSRGGKLAALQYAVNPAIKAAFLLDPVDSTNCSKPKVSDGYPNALERVAGKKLAQAGAGYTGSCDSDKCTGVYYKNYFEKASAGSVLYTIHKAGHFSFTKPFETSDVWKCTQGLIVKTGGRLACDGVRKTLDGKTTIELAATTMIAWFGAELRNRTEPPASFLDWLSQQEAKGLLAMDVKGGHKHEALHEDPALHLRRP